MKIHSRLKHAAGPVLSKFLGRNNDLHGFWAPGLLYRELNAAPHCLTFDLKNASAQPAGDAATLLATRYSAWLRTAMHNSQLPWDGLKSAVLKIEFNARVTLPASGDVSAGEPCLCTIELVASSGHAASMLASARCAPWRAGKFSRSGRALPLS